MNINTTKNVIVGAGLVGLKIAQSLKAQGQESLVLEKSKGLGGRIATRRIDDLGFDHGAPFVSCPEAFQNTSLEVVTRPAGYFVEGGMNQLPKELAVGLNISKNERVGHIIKEGNLWRVETEEGLTVMCKNLILTAPVPQALSLLEANKLTSAKSESLKSIKYAPALISLTTFDEIPAELKSLKFEEHEFLFMRERKLHPTGVVLKLSDEFAEILFEETDEFILQTARTIIERSPLKELKRQKEELKKWRYSRPYTTFPESYVEVEGGLFLTGDGFNGALRSVNNLVQVLSSLA